ncbi:cytochrome P450 [Brevibacterium daeguense]|uniref:Cytochrome P450 n=1 Tax=Brevibacterium daeguense TaxID=909936 RepID=A0ABP8EHV0_9MICO|nr:cytochrome P450 [Brevibacterium daeguense]
MSAASPSLPAQAQPIFPAPPAFPLAEPPVTPGLTQAAQYFAMAQENRVLYGAHPWVLPMLDRIAARGPIVRIPGLGVVVSEARLARSILMDRDHFSKTGRTASAGLWTPVLGPSVLLNMEGADHLRLRRTISGIFTPKAVAELTADTAAGELAEAVARLESGLPVDVVKVATRIAGAIICRLTGLPVSEERIGRMLAAIHGVTSMVRLHRPSLTPRQVEQAKAAMSDIVDPARQAWRAQDESTIPGRMAGLGLTEDEAVGAVGAFIVVGTETIVSFLPRLLALALDSRLWNDLVAERAAGSADRRDLLVEEALRVTVPTPVMLREATADVRVGGASAGGFGIRAGERIIIATLMCCRNVGPFDPAARRAGELKQLWFGAGPHFCLGAPVATAQTDALLDALLDVCARTGSGLRIVSRAEARGVLIPGYARLEIALTKRSQGPHRRGVRR